MKLKNLLPLVSLICFMAVSCATNNIELSSSRAKKEVGAQYTDRLCKMYPEQFTVKQRIVLTVAGKQYDFIGYLAAWKGRAFRAIAYGDMGGKYFDFLFRDGRLEVVKCLLPLNEEVEKGVRDDILHLFMFQPEQNIFLTKRGTAGYQLTNTSGDKQVDQYRFDALEVLISSCSYSEGRKVREVTYSGTMMTPEWPAAIPCKITLENYEWHYSLEITTIEFKPRIESDRIFQP